MSVPWKKISPAVGSYKPQQTSADGGFAAPRLTHQAEGFSPADGEADPVHGVDITDGASQKSLADGEILLQALDPEQEIIAGGRGRD